VEEINEVNSQEIIVVGEQTTEQQMFKMSPQG